MIRRIFFDTEFSDLIVAPKLISIGLVDEAGGQSFYAELTDTWILEDVGQFARGAVLPLLQGDPAVQLTMGDLRIHLGSWISSFGGLVKLATDSLRWDWPWIQELFAPPNSWPENLAGEPLLLTMNYLIDYDQFEQAVEHAFTDGLRRHHALDDAEANRRGWVAAGGDIERTPTDGRAASER